MYRPGRTQLSPREKIRGVIVLLSDPDRGVIVLLHFPTVQRHDSRSNGMTPGG
jgi:hypothetical protein